MRRIFVAVCLALFLVGQGWALELIWCPHGTNTNWTQTGATCNWRDRTAGSWVTAIPTNSDNVYFDNDTSTSNCIINASAVAKTVTCTGYTYNLAFNGNLIVSGSVTFVGGMTLSADATTRILTIQTANETFTSGGLAIPCSIWLLSAVTHTLGDTITVVGTTTLGNTSGATTINGNGIKVQGNLVQGFTSGAVTGSAKIIIIGNCAITSNATTGSWGLDLIVNTAGTVTFPVGQFNFGHATATPTLTYTAGTVTTVGSILYIRGAANKTIAGAWSFPIIVDTCASSGSTTINTTLTATSYIWLPVNCTFAGTAGFRTPILRSAAGLTHFFKNGVTYTVTDSLSLIGSVGSPITLSSAVANNDVYLNMTGSKQAVSYVTAIDINSSSGYWIYDANGTLTRTTKWATSYTAPAVASTLPANAATHVLVGVNDSATFNVDMDSTTIGTSTFTLADGGAVAGAVTYSLKKACFNPTADLTPNTAYTGTLTVGCKDVFGQPLAAPYTWIFTTDATPTVTAVSPLNGATGVAVNAVVTGTFSVGMDAATITTSTFTVGGVTGTVGYAAGVATFTPSSNLAYSTSYTATLTTGIHDSYGTPLGVSSVWSFTTAANPSPVVHRKPKGAMAYGRPEPPKWGLFGVWGGR